MARLTIGSGSEHGSIGRTRRLDRPEARREARFQGRAERHTRATSTTLNACARGAAALIACGVMVVGFAGCRTTPTQMRGGAVSAEYFGTTLSTTLGPEFRVPTVIAATEEAMRARGYTIVETSVTEESGTIVGRPPRFNVMPRMVVEASMTGEGTRISLRYEPFGDREVCEAMLDAVLRRLGV